MNQCTSIPFNAIVTPESHNKNFSSQFQFIPTIYKLVTGEMVLILNEDNFVRITKNIFEDDYKYLGEVGAVLIENERRTSPAVLSAFTNNGYDLPKSNNLPASWFDPFAWRFELTEKFKRYLHIHDLIFDVGTHSTLQIISERNSKIYLDNIEEIQYNIRLISGKIF